MRYLELRIPPPIVGLTVAAAMWLAASRPSLWPPSSPVRLSASVILLAAGIATALSAVMSFRQAQTTVNPLKPETSTSLVSTGIFGRTRNPMYLGMLIGLLAWAVYLASAPAWLGPAAFVLYITRFQIVPEERAMHSLFGSAFSDYARRVRRWV
jgi:protein-S-isoprenylcysteine O-methyltransferase Ste14